MDESEAASTARWRVLAFIRGLRDYNDAFIRHDPRARAEVVDNLIEHTVVRTSWRAS